MPAKPGGDRLAFVDFMLPSLVDKPPADDDWVHEIKHDGYRTQLIVEKGVARAFSRRGHDWTSRYRPVVEAASELPVQSAIIDGEMVAFDGQGRSSIEEFRKAMQWDRDRLVFIAFDLLHLNGVDLRRLPTLDRKDKLASLIAAPGGAIQFSEHVTADGASFFASIDALGLEGMVSKRPHAPYRSGPSDVWLKTKSFATSEYEVAGFRRERGKAPFAIMAEDGRYIGSAFINLSRAARERLHAMADDAGQPPLDYPKDKEPAEWLRPGLIGIVRHLRGEDTLRHASLIALKEK